MFTSFQKKILLIVTNLFLHLTVLLQSNLILKSLSNFQSNAENLNKNAVSYNSLPNPSLALDKSRETR